MTPTLATQVRMAPDALQRRVGGETILLQLTQSVYHALDPVGSRMLELLLASRDIEGALGQVVAEYDVERAQAEADLLALVSDLHGRGQVSRRLARTRLLLGRQLRAGHRVL